MQISIIHIINPPLISLKFTDNGEDLNTKSLEAIGKAFDKGAPFWKDQLLYEFRCHIDESLVILELCCTMWSANKMSTLLQKPSELRPHMNLPSVAFCTELQVQANFYHSIHKWNVLEAIRQINEYLSSLIVSQLEFQLPLVFSIVTRNRFKSQENDIGPISYGLTQSSALIPLVIELIVLDKTATTVYQILRPRRQTKRIQFRILIDPSDLS